MKNVKILLSFKIFYTIPCVTGVLGKLRSGPAKHVIVGEGHRKGEEVDRGDIGSSN